MNKIFRSTAILIFTISTILLGISCKSEKAQREAPAEFEKSFAIELTNPLPAPLENHAVVIPVADILRAIPDFNVLNFDLTAAEGQALPYQVDDLDGDGNPDELAFIAMLPPGVTEISCGYAAAGTRPNSFPPRTYARLAWETVNANIGWESNRAAYRFYWGQLEGFGKLDESLIMAAFNANYVYHEMQTWGMDILHVGDASGLGGISLWEGDSRISTINPAGKGENVYERKVIAAGPVRAVARVDISHIGPAEADFAVTLIMSAFTDSIYSRQDILIRSSAGGQVVYSPGVEKLPKETWSMNEDKGYLATWGEGAPGAGEVGLALIFAPAERIGFAENDLDRYVKLAVPSGEKRTHWIIAGWHLGITAPPPPQASNWAKAIEEMSIRLTASLNPRIIPR
jgi:hypothetical protein